MVFTDPPYGVSASGGRSQTKEKLGMTDIKNDELRANELTEFLSKFISVMQYKVGASLYICYPWATQNEFTCSAWLCVGHSFRKHGGRCGYIRQGRVVARSFRAGHRLRSRRYAGCAWT